MRDAVGIEEARSAWFECLNDELCVGHHEMEREPGQGLADEDIGRCGPFRREEQTNLDLVDIDAPSLFTERRPSSPEGARTGRGYEERDVCFGCTDELDLRDFGWGRMREGIGFVFFVVGLESVARWRRVLERVSVHCCGRKDK